MDCNLDAVRVKVAKKLYDRNLAAFLGPYSYIWEENPGRIRIAGPSTYVSEKMARGLSDRINRALLADKEANYGWHIYTYPIQDYRTREIYVNIFMSIPYLQREFQRQQEEEEYRKRSAKTPIPTLDPDIQKLSENVFVYAGEVYSTYEAALLGKQRELEEETKQARISPAVPNLQGTIKDEKGQFKLFQVKTIFNSVQDLSTKLKSINKTIAAIGSDKNLDETLKKAGIDAELRSQFIALVKSNPELRNIKIGDVLTYYLKQFEKDVNDQYYKAILEPINKELEDLLIKYFEKFNITRVELENLKAKFGVDSTGVYDVLNKTVYYAQNRNLLTLPEEYGHVFVELLGAVPGKKLQNPLFQYLYENIETWEGYARVFEDYKNLYVNANGTPDTLRIKKEAIGQAIGLALVRNFENVGVTEESKGFWAKVKEAFEYIAQLIKGIDYVSLNTAADSIARDILSNNYSKLDRLLKDTSNYNLLSYSETIKLQNKKDGGRALKFMQWFSNKGMIITGSLSYRLQGETFRPEIDALHDIDNVVPADVHGLPMSAKEFENEMKDALEPSIVGTFPRFNADKLARHIPVLTELKQEFPDTEFLYAFPSNKQGNYFVTINAIWSENSELKNRFKSYTGSFNDRLSKFTEEELGQMYLFDFFLSSRSSESYITIQDQDFGLTLNHFAESFYEKQGSMGRPKDSYDYQKWKAFENTIPAPLDLKSRLVYFQLGPSTLVNDEQERLISKKREEISYPVFSEFAQEEEEAIAAEMISKVKKKLNADAQAPVDKFQISLIQLQNVIDSARISDKDLDDVDFQEDMCDL